MGLEFRAARQSGALVSFLKILLLLLYIRKTIPDLISPTNPRDPVYLYDNTFDISTPINWNKSGGSESLDNYRLVLNIFLAILTLISVYVLNIFYTPCICQIRFRVMFL